MTGDYPDALEEVIAERTCLHRRLQVTVGAADELEGAALLLVGAERA